MPIYNGSDKIIGIYWNGRYHTAAYLGNTLVWKKSEPPALLDWLCFTAQETNSTVEMAVNGTLTKNQAFEASTDGVAWTEFVPGTTVVTLANVGDKVFFRGDNETVSEDGKNYLTFTMTGVVDASGNVMSLLSKELTKTDITHENCFAYLFNNCTSLRMPPKLPATNLGGSCYWNMFNGCENLEVMPNLPATILTYNCYSYMFSGCKKIIKSAELPAMNLAQQCYAKMFYKCTGLKNAPALPATALQPSCYDNMFYGCTSLVAAPELPITTTAGLCCERMFMGCTSLTKAPVSLPAMTLKLSCYRGMFYNCTALVVAPELPATVLASQCYYDMFNGCKSLRYIKLSYSGTFSDTTDVTKAFYNWVKDVSNVVSPTNGDFYYNGTDTTRGNSAIPVGWTVHTF